MRKTWSRPVYFSELTKNFDNGGKVNDIGEGW